ncbi:hypothetical protein A7U60_g2563 [Sanghuangporus baumii]|uniref:Uncharacterized protein n=1 Tax=Sanghuangporus baumii TaxID=108892 RepID=A0A9Q5I1X6_SANBA|nr:hypothetical protein A7U60_g2563 [Sanghuangporus baumii]
MSIAQLSEKSHDMEDDAVLEGAEKADAEATSEESDDEESSEFDSDEDEELTRKLNEQLLEDIRRAREAAAPPTPPITRRSPREEAALATVKTVLSFATSDSVVRSTLASTEVPGYSNVLQMLNNIAEEGRISTHLAGTLSHVLVKLAKSEELFSPLPPVSQETTLKRKRDEAEEQNGTREKRTAT